MHRQACIHSGMHSNDEGRGSHFLSLAYSLRTLYRFFSYYFFSYSYIHVSASNDVFLSFRNSLFLYFCSISLFFFLVTVIYIVISADATRLFSHIDSAILHRSHSFAAYYPLLHFLCLTSESLLGVGLLRNEIKTIIK